LQRNLPQPMMIAMLSQNNPEKVLTAGTHAFRH